MQDDIQEEHFHLEGIQLTDTDLQLYNNNERENEVNKGLLRLDEYLKKIKKKPYLKYPKTPQMKMIVKYIKSSEDPEQIGDLGINLDIYV